MKHPYEGAEAHRLWSRGVSAVAPGHLDPALGLEHLPHIRPDEPVGTMGSCFAQHIARHLARSGCRYLVTEAAPDGLAPDEAEKRQFGLFSARFGNVYTVRQALQLFDRAFGRFEPLAMAWPRDARWVDPFRPQVEPEGHDSPQSVADARQEHLAAVRRLFTDCRWLVFTLGLTEGWRDRRDGAVFPLAPGVAAGRYDPAEHEYVNFGVDEVRSDLLDFVSRIGEVNPRAGILLTVSPVPLAATAEPHHVWTATSYSKAVLRVAAEEARRRHPGRVAYFPSYEVITSPAAGGRYYADDLRQVTELGVGHVMRLFSTHVLQSRGEAPAAPTPELATDRRSALAAVSDAAGVVCDEETIEQAVRRSAGLERG